MTLLINVDLPLSHLNLKIRVWGRYYLYLIEEGKEAREVRLRLWNYYYVAYYYVQRPLGAQIVWVYYLVSSTFCSLLNPSNICLGYWPQVLSPFCIKGNRHKAANSSVPRSCVSEHPVTVHRLSCVYSAQSFSSEETPHPSAKGAAVESLWQTGKCDYCLKDIQIRFL